MMPADLIYVLSSQQQWTASNDARPGPARSPPGRTPVRTSCHSRSHPCTPGDSDTVLVSQSGYIASSRQGSSRGQRMATRLRSDKAVGSGQ